MSDEPRAIAQLETGAKLTPIIPRNVEEVARLADAIIAAEIVPDSLKARDAKSTKSRVMAVIMKGLEIGFGPMTSLSTLCIINNRISIYGDGAIAKCDQGGAVEWVKHHIEGQPETDDWTAVYQIKRRSHTEPYEGRFSWKQAKRAHLIAKPTWVSYPERMLLARARAFAIREGFADYLMGISIAEEAQDLPPEPQAKLDTTFLGPPQDKPVHEEMPGEAEASIDPVATPAQEPDASA